MNGPQQYAAAQAALYQSAQVSQEVALLYATQAVAHATLALAAATIDAATRTDTNSGPEGYTVTKTDVANGVEWAGVLK